MEKIAAERLALRLRIVSGQTRFLCFPKNAAILPEAAPTGKEQRIYETFGRYACMTYGFVTMTNIVKQEYTKSD